MLSPLMRLLNLGCQLVVLGAPLPTESVDEATALCRRVRLTGVAVQDRSEQQEMSAYID